MLMFGIVSGEPFIAARLAAVVSLPLPARVLHFVTLQYGSHDQRMPYA